MKQKQNKYDYEKALREDKTILKPHITEFHKSVDYLDKTESLWELFVKSAEKHKNERYIGRRRLNDEGRPTKFVWETYHQAHEKMCHLACGIKRLVSRIGDSESRFGENSAEKEETRPVENSAKRDYESESNENIGIFSKNRPEWIVSAFAIQSNSMRTVPLYDSFGKEALTHVINQSNLRIIFCSALEVNLLLELKKSGATKNLDVVIQFDYDERYNILSDRISKELVEKAKEENVSLIGFSEIISDGQENFIDFVPDKPSGDTLAYIMYTSGTSGKPKGAMLTNTNGLSVLRNGIKHLDLSTKGAYLSFLPLAHIFETIMEMAITIGGSHIGYYSGDIKYIAEDIKELRPVYFAAVPRIFEKMYAKIKNGVQKASFLKRWLFNLAMRKGIQKTHTKRDLSQPKPYDKFVWGPLRTRLGFENLRLMVTGGASCPPHLMEFFRVLLRADIIQGYGLTETFAVSVLTSIGDVHLGHTGHPMGCEIQLAPLEGEGSDHPTGERRGEILVRGPNVFMGYYRDKERTREAFDGEWFRTGDVGRFNPNGTLSIVDRRKALFKLSQGEYISPDLLEATYGRSAAVNQVFCHGESSRNFVVAVVVPDAIWVLDALCFTELSKSAQIALNQDDKSRFRELFGELGEKFRSKLTDLILSEMKRFEDSLRSFECVGDVWLEFALDDQLNGFHVENNSLTPSFKLKRMPLRSRYRKQIDEMYAKGP